MSSSSKLPLSAPPRRSRSSREQAPYAPRSSNDISSVDADDEFILVSKDSHLDSAGPRPSLGGESAHYSDMGDSNMSHDPLLSSFNDTFEHERQVASDNRPLTMNKLDPVQRAALVRQSRKLHKILGETPQIAEVPSPSTRPTGNKLQRRGTLAGSDIRLDRKAAMAALESPSLEPPPGSNWGKIASSLVATSPTLATPSNVPLLRLNVVPATEPGMPRQRRLSDSSVASSALSLRTNRQTDSTHTGQESVQTLYIAKAAKSPTLSHDASLYDLSSPITPPSRQKSEYLQRQQSRARMAKVQQLMGESVPSELVLGPTAARDLRKRRLSMESPTAPSFSNVQTLKHKRSKSLWRKDFKEAGFDSAPEPMPISKTHSKSKSKGEMPPIEDLLLKQLQIPTSEKQRALNVKRALKMAAVFGVPPPQAPFTEHNELERTTSRNSVSSRQSLNSLASLAYLLDHDRDSLYDLLANASDSDSDEEGPIEWPYEHKPRSDSLPESQPQSVGKKAGKTKYTVAGTHAEMAPHTPPFKDVIDKSQIGSSSLNPTSSRLASSRPPPLSISVASSTEGRNVIKDATRSANRPMKSPSGLDSQFSVRRRRANKLSKFFGVGYNDLFNSMVYGIGAIDGPSNVPPLPSNTTSPSSSKSNPPSAWNNSHLTVPNASGSRGGAVTVETDAGRSTVLRTSTNLAADVDAEDLHEVMARLRALRA